jgi:hypothetical protein
MGKIDDMRRLREEQFARAARANDDKGAAKKTSAASAPRETSAPTAATESAASTSSAASASTAAPRRASAKAASSTAEEGKCPTCGKVKPLTNGLLANHQKGFGKACAGSRKAPA